MSDKPTKYINLEEIAQSTKFAAVIRLAAMTVQKQQYILPGEFFGKISDEDLDVLTEMTNITHPGGGATEQEYSAALESLIVLTGILETGEGKSALDDDELIADLGSTVGFINLEKLARMGMIEVNRDNFSYIDDNKEIARMAGN